jgi:hypothetical protein
MVSHCANPTCGVPLRYLRDGRLFQFDIRCSAPQGLLENGVRKSSRHIAHYWLCGQCAVELTLEFDPAEGVIPVAITRPIAAEIEASAVA